jgi:hypothetical protein
MLNLQRVAGGVLEPACRMPGPDQAPYSATTPARKTGSTDVNNAQ